MYPVVIEIYRMKLISFSLVGSCTVVGKLVMVKAYSFNRVSIIILQNSHKLKTQPNFQWHPTGFWNFTNTAQVFSSSSADPLWN